MVTSERRKGFHHPEKVLEGSVVLGERRGRAVGDVVRQRKGDRTGRTLQVTVRILAFTRKQGMGSSFWRTLNREVT